ncbi:MAG: xanthine dehydrogenase family protein subunit M [bacterium]|nr:xanthine dehydrogenase family protein subunit M [bacterium]MDE0440103.1 xanthine dehydrogenase family protein subunit M [bacterium]
MRYVAPTTIEEAVAVLVGDDDAKVYAGATDFIPQLRMGRPEPDRAVDLKRIPRLTDLRLVRDTWVIGAATPSVRLTEEDGLVADLPGLVEAAALIGSDQIQSRASLGGNLCNASPAADSVPAMVVNDARAVIAGPDGTRTVPVASVVTGPGSTSLGSGEFVIEFEFDRPPARTSDAYVRFIPRTEMDIAVVGAGARLSLDEEGRCTAASIALGAVAPTVVRVPAAEAALVGQGLTESVLGQVAAEASAACNPIDDKRGTKEYRRQVAGVLAVRALKLAAARAQGSAA